MAKKSVKQDITTVRLRIILTAVVFGAFLLFIRLFYLQVLHSNDFKQIASGQYQAPKESSFDSGTIFFQEKNGKLVSAATRLTAYTLAVSPRDIKDREEIYQKLHTAYPGLDKEVFMKKTSKKDDPYEEVAKKLTLRERKAIEELKLRGVQLVPEYYRSYPYESGASQVLGFVGFKDDTLTGRYGLERYYNDVLTRQGEGVYVNFFAEIFSDLGKTLFASDKEREGDLVLTIEPNVQLYAEDIIKKTQAKWSSQNVGIIIMDPKTGKIVAMAATPGFDPNDIKEARVETFSNPLVENVYEMGSIIKPLTVAAGLDSGAITRDTYYYDRGDLLLGGYHVRNYDHKARGNVNVQEILSQSLNVGTVFVAQKMGGKNFKEYMLSYGLEEATGIDLPNEATSLVGNLHSNVEVDYLTTSFGQGMALSPIQTVRALAALGNGGKLVTPYVVDKIDYKAGLSKTIVQNEPKEVLKEETSTEISRMLVTVVDKALKGGNYKIPEYTVASKTGTAQMVAPNGRYYDDRYLHSMFAYFPAYDPEYIVFMYHTWPKGAKYASDTLTDPLFDTVKFLISYYEIPPDRPLDKQLPQ
jgi:stage V sporulation protein D (sporulation-specific penicillin-binding protein)